MAETINDSPSNTGGEHTDNDIANQMVDSFFGDMLAPEIEEQNEEEQFYEEEPEEVQEEQPPAPITDENQLVKVRINGEEVEVPLSELKRGYTRTADYTQKTQELSAQRQQLEAEHAKAAQFVQSIPTLHSVAETNINQAVHELNSPEFLKLAVNDPTEYVARRAELESVIVQNQQAAQQLVAYHNQYQAQTTAQWQHQRALELQESSEALSREYGDEWKSGALATKVLEYGIKQGYSAQELEQITNHKIINTLNKARLYDELVSNKDITQQRVNKVPPKVVSSNTANNRGPVQDVNKARTAIRNSRNDHDTASILAKFM